MKHLLTILITILTIGVVTGQIGEANAWYSVSGVKPIHQQWNVHYTVQYRSEALKPTPGMFFILGGMNYQLPDKHWKVGASYYLIEKRGSNSNLESSYEAIHFIREEVAYQYFWRNIKISHKLRLEQVWGLQADLFQQVRLVNSFILPLTREQKLYFNAYSEIFFRYDGTGYNRNRVFAGVQYRFTRPLSIQVGFLSEIFEKHTTKNLFVGIHQSL